MPIAAGQLTKGKPTVVSPTDSLVDAIELMIKHDFSQLPVVNEFNKPLGIITGNSIANALLLFADATVKDLEVKDAIIKVPTPQQDNDILSITDDILKTSATLLTNADGTLSGIITSYDTTTYFRSRAEDISLLEDIENTLKGHLKLANKGEEQKKVIDKVSNPSIQNRKRGEEALRTLLDKVKATADNDDVKAILDKSFPISDKSKTFDDLTLEELIQAAENTSSLLNSLFNNSNKKKKVWAKMMRHVAGIRNKIFHFRGELSEIERQSLKFCASWYQLHQPTQADNVFTEPATEEAPVHDEQVQRGSNNLSEQSINIRHFIKKHFTNNYSAAASGEPHQFEESIKEKYKNFVAFLNNELQETDNIFLTSIEAIEKLICQPLPEAAYEHPSWWMDYSTHARQWLLTGWSVGSVNLANKQIEFYRWSYYIDDKDDASVVAWADKLGMTSEELRKIIKLVGPLSTVVADYAQSNSVK